MLLIDCLVCFEDNFDDSYYKFIGLLSMTVLVAGDNDKLNPDPSLPALFDSFLCLLPTSDMTYFDLPNLFF